jgi:hypothetical protein
VTSVGAGRTWNAVVERRAKATAAIDAKSLDVRAG